METVLIDFLVLFCSMAGLEILSLARLARSQDERVTMLLDPICGIYEESSTLQIDSQTLAFQIS